MDNIHSNIQKRQVRSEKLKAQVRSEKLKAVSMNCASIVFVSTGTSCSVY